MEYPKTKTKKHRKETVKDSLYYNVFTRDGGRCQLCGRTDTLQLHHIYGRGKGLTNKPSNCIMLCMCCHLYRVHQNQRKYRPLLQEIIDKKYKKD